MPHEREDRSRAGPLARRFQDSKTLKNPPLVTPSGGEGAQRYVVLDGANRVAAARASGFRDFLVQRVPYQEPPVRLCTWHHALTQTSLDALEHRFDSIAGLRTQREDTGHARALLARREAIAFIVCGKTGTLTLHGEGTLAERNDLLNSVVDGYAREVPFYRVMRDSLEDARARHPDVTSLVVFPRFQPDEILDLAVSGARLPAGITRHVIEGRALRVNLPLDVLEDTARSLEEKNRWLSGWIAERVQSGRVRYYEESTVLFDE